jgi:two-component system chemotaxis response regulator CheB
MNESTRVFALLGDAALRRQLQQQWRGLELTLCGMHAEGGDSILEELARVRPDVALVDADVDGVRPLVQEGASRRRVPVVAVVRPQPSGFTALRPLEWGAVTVLPRSVEVTPELVTAIEGAITEVRGSQVLDVLESHFPLSGAFPDASVFDMRRSLQETAPAEKLVVVAGGVGGPMAVRRILTELKTTVVSPIVYAQRIDDSLVAPLVHWLVHHTGAQVMRGVSGPLAVDQVYVVPSGYDARFERQNGAVQLCTTPGQGPSACSFDTLFESAAAAYGERTVGVLLSGRGSDGAQGLAAVRRAGGFTMVQDRVSSLVYDAPGQAREGGGAIECLPINEIAERIQMLMRPEPASRA